MSVLKKFVFIVFGATMFACNDANVIGLELYNPSDKITINNSSEEDFTVQTVFG